MSDDNRILREVERQVLDRYHLRFSLLQRNANDAIMALLRCYGDVARGLGNGSIPKDSDDARHQTANKGFRGLAHCLRWIQQRCPRLITVPSSGATKIQDEAFKLLKWGVNYDPLYNQHTAYSRRINGERLVEAEVNEPEKSIKFLPQGDINPQFFISQIEAKRAYDIRQAALYPDQTFSELLTKWYESRQPGQRRGLRFDDSMIACCGALDVAIEWMNNSCLPELSNDSQLGEFSAGSLRRVLAAFHVASLCRLKLEDFYDQQDKAEQRCLTHVLLWRFNELIEWLHEITSVDQKELKAIVPIFTFDSEPERVTLAHKPLVLGNEDHIFLLPRLFLVLPLSQMVVGALNLNSANKETYNNGVSKSIEESVVRNIAKEIRTGCLRDSRIVSEKDFGPVNGKPVKPDIVLLSADSSELLVVDVKNAMPPFGVGDIAEDLKTWSEKWNPQLERFIAAFRKHPEILSRHFANVENASPSVAGLILFRWPFPVPAQFPEEYGVIDWPTLHAHLKSESDSRTISEVYAWIRQRPDVSVVETLKWHEAEKISVDEWTYRYSVLIPSNNKANA